MKTEKQYQLDERYLKMAFIWSMNSKAFRRKVGAIMVKDGMIISDGYNGTPSGMCNCCEDWIDASGNIHEFGGYDDLTAFAESFGIDKLKTRPEVLHAESNAISKISASTQSSKDATIYITDMPCLNCSKMIIQCGIKRVVYARDYSDNSGVELLKKNGIEVENHPIYIDKGMISIL